MDINLFSQNLLVVWSMLAAGLITFIMAHVRKQWLKKRLFNMVVVSIAAALCVEFVVHLLFPSDKLPSLMWLMILPWTGSMACIVAAWGAKWPWLRWMAAGTTVFCFFFSLILINNYYRFYPTLYSIFNAEGRAWTSTNPQVTLQYANTHTASTIASLEAVLYPKKGEAAGSVYSVAIPGKVSGFHARTAWVYIPAVATTQHISMPVLVLTPGYPGLTENWLTSGLQVTMDTFAKTHHGIAPMVFMVDNTGSLTNDTECVNSPRGNVETYLTTDVPAYIKAHYNVSNNPANWAIGGLSMGGMCSLMLTLRHPDVYQTFLDLGGELGPEVGSEQKTVATLFGGSEQTWQEHQPLYLLTHHTYPKVGGFFAIGSGDNPKLVHGLSLLYDDARKANVESVYETVNGEHTFGVWQQAFKDSLPWLSYRMGATTCSSVACSTP